MNRGSVVALEVAFLGVVVCVGCQHPSGKPGNGEQPQPVAETKTHKPPQLYTGKRAFSAMQALAARWTADALPVHLESEVNDESTGRDGKATVWHGTFASPSRKTFRTFTWSGSRLPDAPAFGTTVDSEVPYGPDAPSRMFDPLALITDTDAAFATAQAHGGDTFTKQNPKQPIVYFLQWSQQEKKLLWLVLYGRTRSESKGIGVINASTGGFLRAGK